MTDDPPRGAFETDWRRRRRAVVLTELFCGACIAYLMIWGKDTVLSQTIVNGAWLSGASVLLGYLGFPVLDDRFRRSAVVRMSEVGRGMPARGRVNDPDA